MLHFKTFQEHCACNRHLKNVAATKDHTKVRCASCKTSEQFRMAKGNVFKLDDGKAPTLTGGGGNQEPKVAIIDDTYKNREKRIYTEKCPTLRSERSGLKVACGAFRGRYLVDGKRQDHKGLTAGKTEQHLELRNDDKTNTITSVQKDNVIVPGFENKKSLKTQKRIKANICKLEAKGNCLLSSIYKGAQSNGATVISTDNLTWRKLTPLECERLQTVPDNYTKHVSNSQRYKMLGNGWTVDVVAGIFSVINRQLKN